jgi:hypothetical protein
MFQAMNNVTLSPNQVIMHKCDIRACVNPHHLELGTLADNNRDMFSKGRGCIPHRKGENANGVKLTDEQVEEIKSHPRKLGIMVELSRKYGVSATLIGYIKNGKHR